MSIQRTICKAMEEFRQDDNGATSIEYALLGGILSIAIIAAVTAVGTTLSTSFSTVESGFN